MGALGRWGGVEPRALLNLPERLILLLGLRVELRGLAIGWRVELGRLACRGARDCKPHIRPLAHQRLPWEPLGARVDLWVDLHEAGLGAHWGSWCSRGSRRRRLEREVHPYPNATQHHHSACHRAADQGPVGRARGAGVAGLGGRGGGSRRGGRGCGCGEGADCCGGGPGGWGV